LLSAIRSIRYTEAAIFTLDYYFSVKIMNSRPNSMASGGAGPLKALKDKMQSLRDELDESREKFELAEKQLAAEKLEREKVLA